MGLSRTNKEKSLHLAIDATNVKKGGGLTHLSQLLKNFNPVSTEINKVTIWACKESALYLPKSPKFKIITPFWAEKNIIIRSFFQQFFFVNEIKKNGCEILFSPGGTIPFLCSLPVITLSQNMLPFESEPANHFGKFSLMRFKFWLLKLAQGRSFKAANGVIFLTKYAENFISKSLKTHFQNKVIIPHGIESRFFQKPRQQKPLSSFSHNNPIKFIYVSILMPYKHQCEIAKAAKVVHDKGIEIEIKFIGSDWSWYGKKFKSMIELLDPNHEFLIWDGFVSFEKLHDYYKNSDIFIFGSSCENLPNILIEAMASGLPIVSSNAGPMPEILGNSAVYFNSYNEASIVDAIIKISNDELLRKNLSSSSWSIAKNFSWERCANETFKFIYNTAVESSMEKEKSQKGVINV